MRRRPERREADVSRHVGRVPGWGGGGAGNPCERRDLSALTSASVPLLTTWRERLVRSKPPKLQVLCRRGGREGRKTHSLISGVEVKKGVIHPQRGTTHDDSCLATTWQPLSHGDERGHDVIWKCGQATGAMEASCQLSLPSRVRACVQHTRGPQHLCRGGVA